MGSIPVSIELPSEFNQCELDIATLKALRGDQALEDREIISRLEDTIIKHSRALAFYRGHLNVRKRGINTTLPREVLSEVFYVLAHYDFSIASNRSEPPRLSWLRLAHVCRYWRNIVLTSPRIFSFVYLPTKYQEHLQACLYYSRQVPLTVEYHGQKKVHKRLYSQWLLLLPHLSHTRSLNLKVGLADTTDTALILPSSPTVTKLVLTDPFVREPSTLGSVGKTIDRMFSALPNLLHFSSDLHTLGRSDWTERAFPTSLKVLTVEHPASKEPTPSLQHLISALQKLPSLRQLEFKHLYSGDYSSSSPASMSRIHPLEVLRLDGDCDPCTSILSCTDSTHRLYVQSSLLMYANPQAMDLFLDSLTGLFQRQSLSSEESYVLVLYAHRSNNASTQTHLKLRPTGHGSMIPRETLMRMFDCGRPIDFGHSCFRFSISALVIDKPRSNEQWKHVQLRCNSAARDLYQRTLPFFPHVRSLVVVLDSDRCTAWCAWDAITADLSANVRSLQIVVSSTPYRQREPEAGILGFPLKLCEMENGLDTNGQVSFPFPSLRVLSVSVPVGNEDATRIFVENLRTALEARKAGGYGLMKLILDVSLEKDQLESQFQHLVEILSTEEEYDWSDSEF
ncbi:hypothetical protein QCA50_013744 [Cerrena zonata]|uniref:F-box domain-containing protein n=1 Tax=Cerrena zonata TaxID=2478898 RepID=A0AAW0G0C8_9APHY